MTDEQRQPHSAAYFGPERDFWWNLDHLALIASRRELASVESVLDVGAGVGHWGMLLLPFLAPGATVIGVDREPEWVEQATRRAELRGLAARCRYVQGVAESLPFGDARFDLVTCQTLLIHVPKPGAVIGEMLRVAKPGGHVIAAEPNNRASFLVDSSVTAGAAVEELVDLIRFRLTCERGKAAVGEGNLSVGDLLPGYFAAAGLVDVEAFVSDKASVMVPPYRSDEQRALKAQLMREAVDGTWGWSRPEAERFFVAGGGRADEFDAAWERRRDEARAVAAALEEGAFHSAGGILHYLVAGRRDVRDRT
jgi:SAM-dependent methyltransferase